MLPCVHTVPPANEVWHDPHVRHRRMSAGCGVLLLVMWPKVVEGRKLPARLQLAGQMLLATPAERLGAVPQAIHPAPLQMLPADSGLSCSSCCPCWTL